MDVFQAASSPVSAPSPNLTSVGVGGVDSVQTPPATPRLDSSIAGASKTTDIREAPSADRLAQAVKQVNDSFNQKGHNLYASFEKDKLTGINVVKIVDKKTNETISQMPPKEIVKLAQLIEYSQGIRGQLIHDIA